MPRAPRYNLAGLPLHVVQRGVDRQPCFVDDADRERYLFLLRKALTDTSCRLHAYVLMGNHVHLLASPCPGGSISCLMQRIGRSYVPWFNARHARTGTLWEGRFKSRPITSDRYLLACIRYIDLNPVRAGLARHPVEYRWSSCRHHLGRVVDAFMSDHDTFLELGPSRTERVRAYAALVEHALDEDEAREVAISNLPGTKRLSIREGT